MNTVAALLETDDLPHYTYDEYVQWEGKWELIQGIPFAMTPSPRVEHQRICGIIFRILSEALEQCGTCEALLPIDWPISNDTVVQPDIVVVCGNDIGDKKLETTPLMVFEVLSPSTARKDRGAKYRLYEQAGVRYYCIVDADTKSVDVFVLENDGYGGPDAFSDGAMNFQLDSCGITLDFGKIFNR
ncbi:MAG: Uma2 family endonuclease [bacterium]|nr:Uma2 family endonuclease [bacterium]